MTLQQAIDLIQPGKTIYLKAGTYKYSKTILIKEGNDGLPNARKTLAAYGDGEVIIDFSAMTEIPPTEVLFLMPNTGMSKE